MSPTLSAKVHFFHRKALPMSCLHFLFPSSLEHPPVRLSTSCPHQNWFSQGHQWPLLCHSKPILNSYQTQPISYIWHDDFSLIFDIFPSLTFRIPLGFPPNTLATAQAHSLVFLTYECGSAQRPVPWISVLIYLHLLSWIGQLIQSHGFKYHLYADDMQIFIINLDISPEL